MIESYLGTILPWAAKFAPGKWALCNGQTLLISEHAALYSLIGTSYGGDGITNFNLPDLRGGVPMGLRIWQHIRL
jgi:microcystin-dependent protein